MIDPKKKYTRKEISKLIGSRELMGYLPQDSTGKFLACCINRESNPDAPFEIQVGDGPIVVRKADEIYKRKNDEFPVFMKNKKSEKLYSFVGYFIVDDCVCNTLEIQKAIKKSKRENIVRLIRLRMLVSTM